jgi:hypothetical protein
MSFRQEFVSGFGAVAAYCMYSGNATPNSFSLS